MQHYSLFFSFSRPYRTWSLLVFIHDFLCIFFTPRHCFLATLICTNWFISCYSTVISFLYVFTAAGTREAHIRATCEDNLPCCQSKVELRSPFLLLLLGNHTGVLYGDSCPTPDQTPRCPWCDTAATSRATQPVMWKHWETPSPGQSRQGRLQHHLSVTRTLTLLN